MKVNEMRKHAQKVGNFQCPGCGGWVLQDGTEEADWNHCDCVDEEPPAKAEGQAE